jgi:hypothetical protein
MDSAAVAAYLCDEALLLLLPVDIKLAVADLYNEGVVTLNLVTL